MSATPADAQWREGIEQVHREAAGLLRVHLVKPADSVHLIAAAILGEPTPLLLLQAITQAARQIRKAPRRLPVLCLCCPRPIRKPEGVTFCVTLPDIDRPGMAIGSAICPECAKNAEANALQGLRRLWPELRAITVTDPRGGTA